MPDYLVEVFIERRELRELAHVARHARAGTDGGTDVRYLGSIAIPDDEMCFHLYAGPSAGAVAAAARRAGITFDRIIEMVHVDSNGVFQPPSRDGTPS